MSLSTFLDAVERRLSATLEVGPLRIFRARLEPVHIVRYLDQLLDRHTLVTSGAVIVPHEVLVRLNPADESRLSEAGADLPADIAGRLERSLKSQGKTLLSPMIVRLESDPMVALGQVRGDVVVPTFTELETGPLAATSPLPVIKNGAGSVRITLPDGEVARFSQPVVSIGRSVENDVVIDDPQISRRHAELHLGGGQIELRDLESTNGTWVGGNRIRSTPLTCPVRVKIGGAEIQIDSSRA
jgi:hypothetical protein